MENSSTPVGLQLQLLGWWSLRSAQRHFRLGRREQRLVALLALRGHRARLDVAGTLWPNTTDARALASLRAATLLTRRTVSDLLASTRTTIGLNPSVRIDVQDVLGACARVKSGCDGDPGAQLAELGHSELLPGWYEDWVLCERERLQQVRVTALEALARNALAQGWVEVAAAAARMAVAIEPFRECPHVLLIRAHLAGGNQAIALHEFNIYRKRLQQELGIGPSRDLVELVAPLSRTERGDNRADPRTS